MRFNATELLHLAHQPSGYYDKEGVLYVKEKQDGIFRKSKGEVYVERLFRLRGNLLFYFKTKDPSSEVLGIYVLERCVVQLDEDEDDFYSLSIYFDGDEKVVRLSSRDESERDSWIGNIHIASYECLKIQMESLRDRLLEKTGADPLQDQLLSADNCMGITRVSNDETFLEMSMSCSNVPGEVNGQPPDTFASVHYLTSSSSGRWIQSAHTEIVEKESNPFYLSTVSFGSSVALDTTARVKVIVHSVKERMTNAMTQLGAVEFLMSDVLPMLGEPVTFSISTTGGTQKTFSLVILMWYRDGPLQDMTSARSSNHQPTPSNGKQIKPAPLASIQHKRDVDQLRCFYAGVLTKTFRLKVKSSNLTDRLIVHEYMGESKLTYLMPKLLLKLLIEEERSRISQLQDLGTLDKDWDTVRKEVIDFYMSTVASYEQHVKYLSSLAGTYLKASAKKSHKEVEFAPTNLHIQRMVAYTTSNTAAKTYDVITVGAFMAGAQKFKHGGLRRLLSRLDSEQAARTSEGSISERLTTLADILSSLPNYNGATMMCCDKVCSAAVEGNSADILKATAELVCQTRDLIKACEHPLVNDGIGSYSSVQVGSATENSSNPRESLSNGAACRSESILMDKNWKWSGTDIVRSSTDEPWELTRSNCEAALICVQSKVDALVEEPMEHAVKWLDKISPLIIKLKRCVEVMCSRARSGLLFVFIQECGENLPLIHSIRYRRDVILAQALTAATAGFITKLYRFSYDKSFMAQLSHLGVLMEFESLLSCYGEDVGMLEDMVVGVEDLAKVVFRLEKVSSPRLDFSKLSPTVSGDRCHLCVTLPVDEELYNQLPQEMKQNGIKVVPVLFNIGINELATMAEKFGSTTLQETINIENYKKLSQYYKSYLLWRESVADERCSDSPLILEDLMRHLHVQVLSKKNKNVEVLHLASTVCQALNGVRYTSCKSAKDRTSMAVTLEQVQLLQKENSLDPETFMQTLECMRSQGVRRENTYKNTGFRKYAFNSIQVLALPKLYRPPAGTYGNYDT